MVALGNRHDNGAVYAGTFCRGLKENQGLTSLATIFMQVLLSPISTIGSAPYHLTYKTITIMQYIFIVALEFVLAFLA